MVDAHGIKPAGICSFGDLAQSSSINSPRWFLRLLSVCVLFALAACRTFSENDCTMVAPADPCLSPTKGELVYSKTAKQCLEEISGKGDGRT